MAITHYQKGRKKEYRICNSLREAGYDIVQRSAGSKSSVDIWAVRRKDHQILLVQSKGKKAKEEKKEVKKEEKPKEKAKKPEEKVKEEKPKTEEKAPEVKKEEPKKEDPKESKTEEKKE